MGYELCRPVSINDYLRFKNGGGKFIWCPSNLWQPSKTQKLSSQVKCNPVSQYSFLKDFKDRVARYIAYIAYDTWRIVSLKNLSRFYYCRKKVTKSKRYKNFYYNKWFILGLSPRMLLLDWYCYLYCKLFKLLMVALSILPGKRFSVRSY